MLKSLSWWARLESREEKSESLEAWLEAARTWLCLSAVVHCSCNRTHQEQGGFALKRDDSSPDKQCKKTVTLYEAVMRFLAQYPLIRYVVEVLFMLSVSALVLSMMVSSWSFYTGRSTSAARRSQWKRPDEMGQGCWKAPK